MGNEALAALVLIAIAGIALAVSAGEPQSAAAASSCILLPGSIAADTFTQTPVSPRCYSGPVEVICPPRFSWNSSIGSVAPDPGNPFYAIFSSGTSSGNGSLHAVSGAFSCSIPVTVNTPQGASGMAAGDMGSASSGGSFRTTASFLVTCEGEPVKIRIAYLDPSAPLAKVEVFYKDGNGGPGSLVFSQDVGATSGLQFIPENPGLYELHVSVGSDQATADIPVPECVPAAGSPAQNATLAAEPASELLLHRTFDYPSGFSKDVRVYRMQDEAGQAYYYTQVLLAYTYLGSGEKQNFSIYDLVPDGVLSSLSQLSFDSYPYYYPPSQGGVAFEWYVSALSSGESVRYGYTFSRPMTEQMLGRLQPPQIIAGQNKEVAAAEPAVQPDIAASLISTEIFTVPLPFIAAGLVVLALFYIVYSFVFRKRQ
jgi:hypothetical protein